MPELPEVETIVKGLKKVILDKKISGFEKKDQKIVRLEPEEIIGTRINKIERHAKIIEFGLDSGKNLLIHLKMTGQLIWEEKIGSKSHMLRKKRVAGGHPSDDWVATLPNQHTRAVFHFNDGSILFFNDLRRFGYLKLVEEDEEGNLPELKKLGPEPFMPAFNVKYLENEAKHKPKRKVKQFLTDQEIISGVGNIYSDEALFYAKIRPGRLVSKISKGEWKKIIKSVRKALDLGIKYGGSSEETYVDAFGNRGTMSEHTKVYRKTGKDCPNGCGGKIKKTKMGGRSTHFCPVCQK